MMNVSIATGTPRPIFQSYLHIVIQEKMCSLCPGRV